MTTKMRNFFSGLSDTMRLAMNLSFTLSIISLVLAVPQSAAGQVLYGTITGTVTDASAAIVPQATVVAVNNDTGFTRTINTNAEGLYKFSDLTPGSYTVTVTMPGFTKFQETKISVLVNQVARVDAALKLGDSQTIDVSAAPAELQTEKADTSYTLEQKQISALPTTSSAGRNFQSLFKIIPGSTPPAESNSAAGNPQRSQVYNVNGITNTTNTTRIDGAIDAFPTLSSLVAYLPPPDGIESISVVTGSFNAEQGSAGGAAVNVTIKSGTNRLHGSLWEYNSIAQFNAQSWQNRTGIRQKNIYNEYGLSIGGPILKDKLFVFGDWNRVQTNRAVNGTLSVPTAAVRTGDFSQIATRIYDPNTGTSTGTAKSQFAGNRIDPSRISAAAAKLIAALPLPNLPGEVNNYFGSATTSFTRDNIDTKLTYNPSQKIGVFGHYSVSPDTILDPQVFGAVPGGPTFDGGQPGSATGLIQNVGFGMTDLVTPNILVDANAGFTRQFVQGHADDFALGNYGLTQLGIPGTNNAGNVNYSGVPGFTFASGTYTSLGNSTTSSPFTWRDNQYTGNVNVSYTRGRHTYRFGGEYLHAALNHFQPGSLGSTTPRGGFTFSGGVTALNGGAAPNNFNALADFLLGTPNVLGKSIQIFDPLTLRYSGFSGFAQDTWQVSTKLTLNYGFRYEYYPVSVADHYGIFRYDPTVLTTVTDSTGTHRVGTVIVGGRGGNGDSTAINNHNGMVVPRFGVSYRIDNKSVLRAGFGMTVDPDNLRSMLSAYPGTVGLVQNAANAYVAAGSLTTGIPVVPVPDISSGSVPLPFNISTYTVPKDYRRGYIESYNLAFQRELPFRLIATATYAGTHSVRQQTLVNLNPGIVGAAGGNTGRQLNVANGANFNNTDIFSILPFRGSVYNGLQTQLTRSSGRLGLFGLVYTFSKAMNVSDNGQLGQLNYADPAYHNSNWSLAGYDRKHNFQVYSVLQSPFGKGRRSFTNYLVRGWQVSNILSRVSGTPITVLSAATSLNAPGNTQVADVLPGLNRNLNSNNNGFRQYLNPAAYQAVTSVRFGNSGRNSVRGPGFFNLDMSLSRSFPIYREAAFVFQAESFNITNTPLFANPATTISTPASFGIITTSNSNRTLRLSGHITF